MNAQPAPTIAQVAQRVHDQEQAPVVYRLHRVFDVHAGPMHRHDDIMLAIASQSDDAVKVRVIRDSVGGKAADSATTAHVQNQYEHPAPGDVFHRPFDPRYAGEYTVEAVDAQTYRFTSRIHDSGHGDGTFWLDTSGNVVKYQYTPSVLPRYTNAGTIVDERAQVLPNVWAVTRETQQYTGHYAVFGGGASVTIDYDSFSRYPDLASAVAAVERMQP